MHEKIVRLQAGESTRALAQRAGLPASTVGNAVNGHSVPKADNALRIARALGVSLDWLADDTQGWPPPGQGIRYAISLLDPDAKKSFEGYRRQFESEEVVVAASLALLHEVENGLQISLDSAENDVSTHEYAASEEAASAARDELITALKKHHAAEKQRITSSGQSDPDAIDVDSVERRV